MSTARQQAMAQLATQINNANAAQQAQNAQQSPQVAQLNKASGAPTPLTVAQQQRANTAFYKAEKARVDAQAANDQRMLGFQRAVNTGKNQGIRTARLIGRMFQNVGNNTGSFIERIPTPGGIAVPLITLLILWLVLIPINGNSRLIWFFLVLIGQAHLTGAPSTEGQVLAPAPPGFSQAIAPILGGTNTNTTGNTNQTITAGGVKPVSSPAPTPQPVTKSTPQPIKSTSTNSQSTIVKKHSIADQLHHTSHGG